MTLGNKNCTRIAVRFTFLSHIRVFNACLMNSKVRFPGWGNLIFSTACRPALGPTEPTFQRVPGAIPPKVKRPGRETDHSLPSSAEVKNVGAIPPLLT
jgi:hypothetical protein